MKLAIIGSGYVGLTAAVVLADLGHNVISIDKNSDKIKKLNKGESTIYEPDLNDILRKNLEKKQLRFTTEICNAIIDVDLIFIAVNTPSSSNGDADLSFLYKVVEEITPILNSKQIIVIKSTVPPGTCLKIENLLRSKGMNNSVISNPEFLREGTAISDLMYPDRIIIGSSNKQAALKVKDVYKHIANNTECLITDTTSAELIKYASNSFLATKIAYINEIANICEMIGGNINNISYGMELDKRIGKGCLTAGPGFGGSCFPKDILAIANLAANHNVPIKIIEAVVNSNNARQKLMVKKIVDNINNLPNSGLAKTIVGILGLTYKANTDDVRSSPAMNIINLLKEYDYVLQVFDPKGMDKAKLEAPDLIYKNSIKEVAVGASALIILTEWKEFIEFDYSTIHSTMLKPLIIDLRNILDKKAMLANNFQYIVIGQKY